MKNDFLVDALGSFIQNIAKDGLNSKAGSSPDPGPNSFDRSHCYEVSGLQEREDLIAYAKSKGVPVEDSFDEMTMKEVREFPNLGWCQCNQLTGMRRVEELKNPSLFKVFSADEFRHFCDVYQDNQIAAKANASDGAEDLDALKSANDCFKFLREKAGGCAVGVVKFPGMAGVNRLENMHSCETVWEAVNGRWAPAKNENAWYVVVKKDADGAPRPFAHQVEETSEGNLLRFNPWPFKTRELAAKAVQIDPAPWIEVLGF